MAQQERKAHDMINQPAVAANAQGLFHTRRMIVPHGASLSATRKPSAAINQTAAFVHEAIHVSAGSAGAVAVAAVAVTTDAGEVAKAAAAAATNAVPASTTTNAAAGATVGTRTISASSWVERYRPQSADGIVGQPNVTALMHSWQTDPTATLPNLVMYGPSGTGKTSAALVVARTWTDATPGAILELHASDTRAHHDGAGGNTANSARHGMGVEMVRQTIKQFAKQHVNLSAGRTKVVILEDADRLSQSAQQALRRIMEVEAKRTRFIFVCGIARNDLIDALHSRCVTLAFQPIPVSDITSVLSHIGTAEEMKPMPTDAELTYLASQCDGDLRAAIQLLQVVYLTHGVVDASTIDVSLDRPARRELLSVLQACRQGRLQEACLKLHAMCEKGFMVVDLCDSLCNLVRDGNTAIQLALEPAAQMKWLTLLAMTKLKMMEGCTSRLQLDSSIASLSSV